MKSQPLQGVFLRLFYRNVLVDVLATSDCIEEHVTHRNERYDVAQHVTCIIGDEVLNVRQFTSVFDAITKDKPTLADFLRSLPVIEAPWDGAFQERFCVECGADSCDDCPNEQFRNNPEWWLSLPAAEVEQ